MLEAPNPASVANDHFQIIVAGIVTVFVALIPLFIVLIKNQTRTRRIEDQVANNHSTNLREEADDRHEENAARLERIATDLGTALELIAALTRGQGRLYDLIVQNTEDIAELEKSTQQHPTLTKGPTLWTPSRPSPKPSQEALSPGSEPPA